METLVHILAVIVLVIIGITVLWFRYRLIAEKNFRRFYKTGHKVGYFDGEERLRGTVIVRKPAMTFIKSSTGVRLWVLNENLFPLMGVDYSKEP